MTENKTSQSSTISCVSTILSSDRCSSLIHKSFAVVTMGVKTANCHPGHMRITELFQQSCEQLHHKLLTMGDVLFAVVEAIIDFRFFRSILRKFRMSQATHVFFYWYCYYFINLVSTVSLKETGAKRLKTTSSAVMKIFLKLTTKTQTSTEPRWSPSQNISNHQLNSPNTSETYWKKQSGTIQRLIKVWKKNKNVSHNLRKNSVISL